jgi:pimeloyl-ACP methyl ester carboxylesterase
MVRIARDLIAVLDDAGVRDALVVGHSMGVQTALEVYRQAPERVLGLVLVAGTAANPARTFYGTSLGDLTFPIGAAIVRLVPEVLAPVWATIGPATIGHLGARLIRAAGPKATREDLRPYLLHLRSVDPSVLVLMAAAMREHDATDLLPDITAPTLVCAAGADVFTPARCSEAIHHAVVGSELVTFADAGHTLPVEEPEALAAVIGDFVQRRIAVKPRPRSRARRSS